MTAAADTDTPDGCRWCNEPERSHGRKWHPDVLWHSWAAPTDGQRLTRMRARRSGNGGAR